MKFLDRRNNLLCSERFLVQGEIPLLRGFARLIFQLGLPPQRLHTNLKEDADVCVIILNCGQPSSADTPLSLFL
jgi:hypothetical protein